LAAPVGDNLQRLKDSGESEATPYKRLLEFILDDDLIREEVTEIFLEV
jgi:hypothetical protein